MKSSLHRMEKISEDFVLRTQQDADKQNQSDAKTSEGRRARMQQEANQLRVQLNNLISENREVETSLRKVGDPRNRALAPAPYLKHFDKYSRCMY